LGGVDGEGGGHGEHSAVPQVRGYGIGLGEDCQNVGEREDLKERGGHWEVGVRVVFGKFQGSSIWIVVQVVIVEGAKFKFKRVKYNISPDFARYFSPIFKK
tara:strand:+ start:94 stop:396 length:303 start_codon:yes stop_codon:yes gene_type:complete